MKKISLMLVIISLALSFSNAWAKGKPAPEGVININTASAEDLTKLPGIGRSKAEAIVTYRQAHPFKAVAELAEVKGIGPKMLEKIQNHITVDGLAAAKAPVALGAAQ